MYYTYYDNIKDFTKKSRFAPLIVAMILTVFAVITSSYIFLNNIPPVADPVYSGYAKVVSINETESKALLGSEIVTIELFNSSVGDIVGVYQDNLLYTNNPLGHSASAGNIEDITANFVLIVIGAGIVAWFTGYGLSKLTQRLWLKRK